MTETFVWCQMKYKKGDLVVWSSSNIRGLIVEADWNGEHGDNRYRILWAKPVKMGRYALAVRLSFWYYEEDYFRTDIISLLVGERLDDVGIGGKRARHV